MSHHMTRTVKSDPYLLSDSDKSSLLNGKISVEVHADHTHTTTKNGKQNYWKGATKWKWTAALFVLGVLNYSCRNVAPVSAVAMGTQLGWDKAQTGLVLSSFFWGYSMTQVPAGYVSDVIGGEEVITMAAIGWGSLTFITPYIVYAFPDKSVQMTVLVIQRIIFGTFEALHFPAVISLVSRKIATENKSSIYSIIVAGSPAGLILCGSLGSYLLHKFNWETVFYVFGAAPIIWALAIRMCLMKSEGLSIDYVKRSCKELFWKKKDSLSEPIPWKIWFKSKAVWAMFASSFCSGYVFFLLFSWLPTYFEEKFPGEKGWVFNVVPWLVNAPSRVICGFIADKLVLKYSVTSARKIMQGCYGLGITICLLLFTYTHSYSLALLTVTSILLFDGFNSSGASLNPNDLAPEWAGFLYGFSNTAGALPGFFAVYISGYILHSTGSWSSVFSSTAVVGAFGAIVFVIFGSGDKVT